MCKADTLNIHNSAVDCNDAESSELLALKANKYMYSFVKIQCFDNSRFIASILGGWPVAINKRFVKTKCFDNFMLNYIRYIAPILGGWPVRKVNNHLDLCKSLNSSQWME